ncbi:MAG: hypothetical protein R3D02_10625 [Hyphomicrobiales bacterium]
MTGKAMRGREVGCRQHEARGGIGKDMVEQEALRLGIDDREDRADARGRDRGSGGGNRILEQDDDALATANAAPGKYVASDRLVAASVG